MLPSDEDIYTISKCTKFGKIYSNFDKFETALSSRVCGFFAIGLSLWQRNEESKW